MDISKKYHPELIKLAHETIKNGTDEERRTFFMVKNDMPREWIHFKFEIFAQIFYNRYFDSSMAEFHDDIIDHMIDSYYGRIKYLDLGFRGCAKRQPLYAQVATPTGFTTIGELQVGDKVIGGDGKPTEVVALSPIVDRPIYELRTEDGRKTHCDAEHLWTVRKMTNVKEKHITLDVQTMLDSGLSYDRVDKRYNNKLYKEYKYAIETVSPIEFETKKLPVDPYTLGVILGDGHITKKHGHARISFHKDDEEHYRRELKQYSISQSWYDQRNLNVGTVVISEVGKDLLKMGVACTAHHKFIPEEYLYGDIEQRKAILEGLMDTDGTAGAGAASFSSVSEQLTDGVVHLVRSLGGRACKRKNNYGGCQSYRVNILFTDYRPFRLERKKQKTNLAKRSFSRIVSIEPVGDALGRCIKVANDDGLYVTDDFLLTHNTSYTKLFIAFMFLNDRDAYRKYVKVLTRNIGNAKQMVTDIYNMIVEVRPLYGDIFVKEGDKKREETMGSFTTTDNRKLLSGTVGMTQRGHLQDAFRPDWLVFDDVEDRESISSLAQTEATIFRIDEAIAGLSNDGSYMCNGNYISDEGVIQWFLNKPDMVVDKIPIMDEDGTPTWPERYDKEKIESIKNDAEDFYGEYMCDPSRADSAFFDRVRVDNDIAAAKQPHRESAGVRYWGDYVPHHIFGMAADTSEGIGKDANTLALFDFGTFENDVGTLVATYFNNRIPPDLFGHELVRVGREFGNCIIAPENNNTGHATIATMRGYPNIYTERDTSRRQMKVTERLGWRTTRKSKPMMFFEFRKDYNDGLIKIYDKNVLKEMRSFTTMDLTDTKIGMVTRHFDLLMAVVIAWQMRKYASMEEQYDDFVEEEPLFSDIGV